MFFNLSNHPSSGWTKEQYEYAYSRWGEIRDLPFPPLGPELTEEDVLREVRDYLPKIPAKEEGVMSVFGEFCFTYAMANLLMRRGYSVKCVHSVDTVTTKPGEDGVIERRIEYRFLRYADYVTLPEKIERLESFEPVFLNCSCNYRSSEWLPEATAAAEVYGRIEDLPIEPFRGDEERQRSLARSLMRQIDEIRPSAVLLDGAFGTFYIMADTLLRRGYNVLVKCSERIVKEEKGPDDTIIKTSQYRFVRYRKVLPYTE